MRCLICQTRISPFRRWKQDSAFCNDEHAEAFRTQTLNRLLGEPQDGGEAARPPLPGEEPLPLDQTAGIQLESEPALAQASSAGEPSLTQAANEPADDKRLFSPDGELPATAHYEAPSPAGQQDLTSLAAGPQDSATQPETPPSAPDHILRQSADEALEALRELARGTRGHTGGEVGQGSIPSETPRLEASGSSSTTDAEQVESGSLPEDPEIPSANTTFDGPKRWDEVLAAATWSQDPSEIEASVDTPESSGSASSVELPQEPTPPAREDHGANPSVSWLSRLTEADAASGRETANAGEGRSKERTDNDREAEPALDEAALKLASADALFPPGAVLKDGARPQDLEASSDPATPEAEPTGGTEEPASRVLSFPASGEDENAETAQAIAETTSAPRTETSRMFDLEPHSDLFVIQPEASPGPGAPYSRKTYGRANAEVFCPSGGPLRAPAASLFSWPEAKSIRPSDFISMAPSATEAPPLNAAAWPVEALRLDIARRLPSNDWRFERAPLSVGRLFDSALARLAAATHGGGAVSCPTEAEELRTPGWDVVTPQLLPMRSDPAEQAPAGLTINDLIDEEPAVRGSEVTWEEMEAQIQ